MRSLIIKIAGIIISFKISSYKDDLIEQINHRYNKFIIKNTSDYTLKLELSITDEEVKNLPLRLVRVNDNKFNLRYNALSASIDLDNKVCSASQPANMYLFDSLLRCLYSMLLVKDNAFLIHACGIINNKKGFLFFGPATSGKTTIAQLSKKDIVLSDEIIAVKRINNKAVMYSTPFWGAMQRGNINKKIEIDSLYRIIKNDKVYVKELSMKDALKEVLQNIVLFTDDKELTIQLFDNCYQLLRLIPCYELHFQKNNKFWQVIKD